MRCASHGRTGRVGPGRPADFARCVAGEFLLDPAIRAGMTTEETKVLQRLRAFLLGLVNVQAAECAPTQQERDLLASLRCRFQVPKEPPLQGHSLPGRRWHRGEAPQWGCRRCTSRGDARLLARTSTRTSACIPTPSRPSTGTRASGMRCGSTRPPRWTRSTTICTSRSAWSARTRPSRGEGWRASAVAVSRRRSACAPSAGWRPSRWLYVQVSGRAHSGATTGWPSPWRLPLRA